MYLTDVPEKLGGSSEGNVQLNNTKDNVLINIIRRLSRIYIRVFDWLAESVRSANKIDGDE